MKVYGDWTVSKQLSVPKKRCQRICRKILHKNLDVIISQRKDDSMRLIITDNYKKLSRRTARHVAGQIELKPDCNLGLPTGSTPLGMYDVLVKLHQEEGLSLAEVSTFNLDEYRGLDRNHPRSFYNYMAENFFQHVDIKEENINFLDGTAGDIEQECQRFENKIATSGGIDLMVLGIGRNGHIGFNEPGKELKSNSHLAELAEETIKANQRFFQEEEEVPAQALTMGMGTILKSDRILLLASGRSKAWAVKELKKNRITPEFPASFLRVHPWVTLIIDQEAADKI